MVGDAHPMAGFDSVFTAGGALRRRVQAQY
jgi:hypothetical protein